MQMTKAILIAAVLLCVWPRTADAKKLDGNDLFIHYCEQPKASHAYWVCRGYIAGVADMLGYLGTICYPTGLIMDQSVDIVIAYLRDHPEKRQLPASDLVGASLKEKFPCN